VFDKSEGRTPECEVCGADYRIPPNIPKDPKKVPRPTRAKTPTRSQTRSPTPKSSHKQVSFDKKDEEIKKLRLQLKQQKTSDPTCEDPQKDEDLVLLKELKNNLGTFKKTGLDITEVQAKIDALEIKCAKEPPKATSEALKRKLKNVENRAEQLAQNVQKTKELLESQTTSLVDAEEEIQRLQEEHKQALKREGYEQVAIPADLLIIPVHLEGEHREQYRKKLEELQGIQSRYQQEAAAITGNLQAFNSPPKEPEKDAKSDTQNTETPDEEMADTGQNLQNENKTSLTKEESDAATKAKDEKRAEAQRAARARVDTVDKSKKQKGVDAAAIKVGDD